MLLVKDGVGACLGETTNERWCGSLLVELEVADMDESNLGQGQEHKIMSNKQPIKKCSMLTLVCSCCPFLREVVVDQMKYNHHESKDKHQAVLIVVDVGSSILGGFVEHASTICTEDHAGHTEDGLLGAITECSRCLLYTSPSPRD